MVYVFSYEMKVSVDGKSPTFKGNEAVEAESVEQAREKATDDLKKSFSGADSAELLSLELINQE